MATIWPLLSSKLFAPVRGQFWPRAKRLGSTLVSSAPLKTGRKKTSPSGWTQTEKAILRSGILADKTIYQLCNEFPDRNFNSVRAAFTQMRHKLGKSYKVTRWSKEDIATLKQAKELGKSWLQIQALFPERSYTQITDKWGILRSHEGVSTELVPCTDEQGEEIVRRRDDLAHTFPEIALDLRWTTHRVVDVYRDRKAWSVAAPVASPRWQDKDFRELKRLHESGMGPSAIAQTIGRSLAGVRSQIQNVYGVREEPAVGWHKDDLDKVKALRASGMSWPEISPEFPNRTKDSIREAYYRHFVRTKRSIKDSSDFKSGIESTRHAPVSGEKDD